MSGARRALVAGGGIGGLAAAAGLRRRGWDVRVLGSTFPDRDDEVTAALVSVTKYGLQRVRERFGIRGPTMRFPARAEVTVSEGEAA